ncbi:MAG TPA: nucleotidyltransferase domain-containing protein [Ktedonosporobacter sp.]|nr:nucleotidyltransferase domain-containing protein [Ktedonosporobacter sp.]
MIQSHVPIPERFQPAYQCIQRLAQDERYLAAYIFGSLARGEATNKSDFDVHVIINEDNPCTNINHPMINGAKLDLSFRSLEWLKATTNRDIERRERIPMIAESIIVFDKTNELVKLKEMASQVRPVPIDPSEYQFMQFMFYHGNNKAERNLESDPITALLVMHVGLNEWLKNHYRLQQHWWVSSKRLLADLRTWDPTLAQLVEQFVATSEVHAKFALWSAIIDHVLIPLGGRQPIAENNCDCELCQQDLGMVQSLLASTNYVPHNPLR